jgi:hypothetical protein
MDFWRPFKNQDANVAFTAIAVVNLLLTGWGAYLLLTMEVGP